MIPQTMRAVAARGAGGPEVLVIAQIPTPQPAPGEVLIAVEAAGISRADAMQRLGRYPPPPGAPETLGLEAAGRIVATGPSVSEGRIGETVCALLAGGGYAEYALAADALALPLPAGWSAVEAATLPENLFTVYDNLVTRGRFQAGEAVLIHGGTSGIGTTAIMLARARGAGRIIATAGSAEKCAACISLGADAAIDYKRERFEERVPDLTGGRGVDVVLDIVGGAYLSRDVAALAPDGRIVCISTQGGDNASIDLRLMLRKRATIAASSLRPRSVEAKAAIARTLLDEVWPLLPARDPIRPVVDAVFALENAAAAHRRLEESAHVGKIVLVTKKGVS